MITEGFGTGKTNSLLNIINNQPDTDKIYLYTKDWYEAKYQYLIKKQKKVGLKHYDMQEFYKDIEEYNPGKNKILIVFDDLIADMISNNKLNSIVTELIIRGRELNISVAFITQSYFEVPEDVRLNSTHHFIMKNPNKRDLSQMQ